MTHGETSVNVSNYCILENEYYGLLFVLMRPGVTSTNKNLLVSHLFITAINTQLN